MKVTVLEPCGYCAGVERAINLAIKTKSENKGKDVVVLGMLVHNEDSLKTLENEGIKTIYKPNTSLEELVDLIKKPSIVILTAHGHGQTVEEKLLSKGHTIVDATCPFVTKSMEQIKQAIKNGKEVFYVGIENHPEAIAALSISEKVHFINASNCGSIPKIKVVSPLVISQTTLSEHEVEQIYKAIKISYPKAIFEKGVCHASSDRQHAIISIKEKVDKIYVVGGKNSNNSKTLFNLAKTYHKGASVELIQNADDINKKDLIGLSHIVISSGASTPKKVIEQIKAKLLN